MSKTNDIVHTNNSTKTAPIVNADVSHKNNEGYSDPTAFEALNRLDEEAKFHKVIKIIFTILELAGFYLDGRITLVSKKTGRTWN